MFEQDLSCIRLKEMNPKYFMYFVTAINFFIKIFDYLIILFSYTCEH